MTSAPFQADIETSDATSLVWVISQNIGVSVLPEDAVMIPTYGNLCLFLLRGLQKLVSFIFNDIRNVLFHQPLQRLWNLSKICRAIMQNAIGEKCYQLVH